MYSQSLMSYAVIKERYHERLHSSIEITKEDFSQLESASNLHLVYFRYMSRFTTAAIQEELEQYFWSCLIILYNTIHIAEIPLELSK